MNYEELIEETNQTRARRVYNRRYAGLEHLCTFEWFYSILWPRDPQNEV